ncbi:MAG: diadenylate cyclase [Desulfomonilia bacterium]|mgnify:CR=1 FL=1|jgi:uncharacterized protein (TIGR00159 family)|nr:diadenylate cyclase [Deltaproteobacteria bacterium]MDX9762479.1 diadenylate cyclase [Desulfomonilia bacterium]HPW69635.1 diadenylate cyclase [Deltaproteobacteria bacterium]
MEHLLGMIEGFRVQDLFDIVIITTLIYVILIWFKDTASRFVFAGISLLGLVYILARVFHLYLTSLVLQGFFTILLIALVVIFQEDIRRFFERLATLGSLRTTRKNSGEKRWPVDVDVIIESVAEFAAKRVGAIIILQGRDPLERHLKGGYDLDGKLTQPILASIFDPHSSGHDGAVIIHDNRVTKFGCHLPLSHDTEKFGKYGLRHTAALGLSERCDALCIVVSEERGTISMVQDGKMVVSRKPSDLSSMIRAFYEREEMLGNKRQNPHWARRNTLEKAVAVMLALGLWFSFGYQKESIQRDFVVPIEYRKISQEWEVEENLHKEVTVTLMGPVQAFNLLDPATLKVSVDLSNLAEGKQEIPLTSDMVRIPSNLSLMRIKPERIRLSAYRLYAYNAPVHVRTTGSLQKGFTLKRVAAVPETFAVLAPDSTIKRKLPIQTEEIDLSQIKDSISMDAKVLLPQDVRLKSGQQLPSVKVVVEVEKKAEENTT